jgi:hypothetical protein
LLVAALALAVAAGAGAAAGALVSSGSSTTQVIRERPVGAPGVATRSLCPGDAGSLLAEIAAMSSADYERVTAQLSLETRTLLGATADEIAIASAAPSLPDASTLAPILARLGADDARVIMGGLSPAVRADVGSVTLDQQVSCT